MVQEIGLTGNLYTNPINKNPYAAGLENTFNNDTGIPNFNLDNKNLVADTVNFKGTEKTLAGSDELTNCLTEKDTNVATTETGNRYKTTNKAKVAGGILGLLAPLALKVIKGIKAGSFAGLFKLKPLLIACPALAAAGVGIGAFIDSCTNTKRAQAADENAQNPS